MTKTIEYTLSFSDWGSSVCQEVWYNENDQKMYVNLNGNIYGYGGVPLDLYDNFRAAYSTGSFYNSFIKNHGGLTVEGYLGPNHEFMVTKKSKRFVADAGTPKALKVSMENGNHTLGDQITWNTNASANVVPNNKARHRHEIVFDSGGKERTIEIYAESVDEIASILQKWESALDLEFRIKKATRYFD